MCRLEDDCVWIPVYGWTPEDNPWKLMVPEDFSGSDEASKKFRGPPVYPVPVVVIGAPFSSLEPRPASWVDSCSTWSFPLFPWDNESSSTHQRETK